MKNAAHYAACTLLVTLSSFAYSQLDAPTIRCLALDANDNVTITWSVPPDPNSEFFNYTIYYSPGSGVFTPIDQVSTYAQDTVKIIGSFAGNASFYVVTFSNGGTQSGPSSDTVSPIIVTLFANERWIDLQWTSLNLPALDSQYRVMRSVDAGSWEPLGFTSFAQRKFTDTIKVCSGTFAYQIELEGLGGCKSRSNVAERLMQDDQAPRQCNIIAASVDSTTGAVHARWNASKSPDVFGYWIYYFGDFTWKETVWGGDVTSHVFSKNGINANVQTELLSVAPFDSCFNAITLWYNQAADSLRVKTLFVDTNFFDLCEGKLGLQWNMPDEENPVGVLTTSAYRVFRKDGNGDLKLLAQLTSADSVFLDSGLVYGVKYTYIVSAVDNRRDQEAFSNALAFMIKPPKQPEFLHISSIKNNHSTGLNEIHVYSDSTAGAFGYYLFRANGLDDVYQLVEQRDEANLGTFVMVDASGPADQSEWAYRVGVYDECGDVISYSQQAVSLFVDGFKLEKEYLNELHWTPYVGFEAGGTMADEYQVYRYIAPTEPEWLGAMEALGFTDDVYDIELAGGRICYFVECEENAINQFGKRDKSISNLYCLDYTPRVFIPTAFSPDGDDINDQFLPDVNFIQPQEFVMRIYDRTGVQVFVTTDPLEGWSGIQHPIGVYAYQIVVRNARGEAIEYSGRVSLIR